MLYHNYFIDFLQFGPYYASFTSNFLPRARWMRPKTHLEWFPHPLHTYTRCLRPFICYGWADGSTITPLPPYLSAQNLGSRLISWVTAMLQMMQGWIGWGSRPTWNGSHIHSIHIKRYLRSFICCGCGWADGSTIMPLPPYLLPQNLESWLIS